MPRVDDASLRETQYSVESVARDVDNGSRTFLWCIPRVMSTALCKCLSFIDGMEVWFEPYLYAYGLAHEYKQKTNSVLPVEYEGNEDVYEEATRIFERFTKCKLEPSRLS